MQVFRIFAQMSAQHFLKFVCVCVCVCACVCMCVYKCVRMSEYVCVCVSICIFVFLYLLFCILHYYEVMLHAMMVSDAIPIQFHIINKSHFLTSYNLIHPFPVLISRRRRLLLFNSQVIQKQ
jgi:hypothetical protein